MNTINTNNNKIDENKLLKSVNKLPIELFDIVK